MDENIKITQFLDGAGKIKQLPKKQTLRFAVLGYLAEKFEPGSIYSEREVNELCNEWHTFGDYFVLRRELVDFGLLKREKDGSKYWRVTKSAFSPE